MRTILTIFVLVLMGIYARPACAQAGEGGGVVEVEADRFGVGNTIRPGTWAGIRLRLTDRGDRAREVVVRLSLRDPDGDTLVAERAATVNPGVAQSVWIYAPMPWTASSSSAFAVTVETSEAAGEGEAKPGRTVGGGRVGPRGVTRMSDALIGVVGSLPAGGLAAYGVTPDGMDDPLGAHELTRVVAGLAPGDLPDRWMGLAMFESLVWLEGEPGTLSASQASAVEEWVRRGGRLIVCVPAVGQAWVDGRANPLAGIMPVANAARRESFDMERARPLLRPRDRAPLPGQRTVHFFTARSGASATDAMPILAIDDGAVAVRRLLDAGSTMIVGLDLADETLGASVDAQMFWHRLLGKRFDVLSRDEIRRLAERKQTFLFARQQSWLDEGLGAAIAKSGSASVGVLLALIVFSAYLLVAGPGSYAVLKARGAAHWSWVVFAGMAGLFTALAWGGAAAIKPLKTEALHLTMLDHVYGQAQQSARSWLSVLLPTYGERRVSIDGEASVRESRDALAPWQDPGVMASASFPDTRSYVMDAKSPSSLTVPARSTVKQFRADWLGGPAWRMPAPPPGDGLELTQAGGRGMIRGTLTHGLPGPLNDVVIVVVRRQIPLGVNPGVGGKLLAHASAWRLAGSWAPEQPLDLEQALPATGAELAEQYFEALAREASPSTLGALTQADPGSLRRSLRRLEALAWRSILGQPDYLDRGVDTKFALQARDATGPDLGIWFTQPCVIIVGRLDEAPLPIPLRVDGKEPPSTGRVVVRWVYPLTPAPPAVIEE